MEIVAHYQNDDEDLFTNSSSSSFLIRGGTNTNNDEEDDNIIFDPPEITRMTASHHNSSYYNNKSAVRDTSDTSRHNQSNNTRDNGNISNNNTRDGICCNSSRQNISGCSTVVVNTHDSILDLESQCGEGDDDDEDLFPIICEDEEENDENMMIALVGDQLPSNSLLFDDDDQEDNFYNDLNNNNNNNSSSTSSNKVRSVSPNPNPNNNEGGGMDLNNKSSSSSPEKKKKKQSTSSIMDGLTLYASVTDSFVDSLCTSTACITSDKYNKCYTNNNNSNKNNKNHKNSSTLFSFQQSCHSALFGTASCPVGQSSSSAAAAASSSHPAATGTATATSESSSSPSPSSCNKVVVSMDIWQLLGCTNPPGESEMEEIWSLRTTPDMLRRAGQQQQQHNNKNNKQHPVRASIRRRLKRIHRLRMDDRCVSGASRHGVTITTDQSYNINNNNNNMNDDIRNDIHNKQQQESFCYRAIDKSYSMQMEHDPLSNFIGRGMIEPIPVEFEDDNDNDNAEEGIEIDGYDSDPEVNYYSASSSMIIADCPLPSSPTKRTVSSSSVVQEAVPSTSLIDDDNYFSEQPHEVVQRPYSIPTDETEMRFLVQQTLNSTWTLTWHPNLENRKKYNISHNKPMCINMWLERGTVITNSGVVVEPAFMWRDAYQPLLLSQHKLNNSTQKPWSMRLLNACRVTPCRTIDRTKYPMARQNSSFLLNSCGGEEFLLEAKGPNEVSAITERWKLVIARFASLAVTEDVGRIAKEFFHPTSESKMLTIADDDF